MIMYVDKEKIELKFIQVDSLDTSKIGYLRRHTMFLDQEKGK